MSIENVNNKDTNNIEKYIYYAQDEFATSNDLDNDDKEDYSLCYKVAETISNNLKIKCPDLALYDVSLIRPDGTILGGFSIGANDRLLSPDKDLILISMKNCKYNEKRIVGTLAHELRHTWQHTYNCKFRSQVADGFNESLDNPEEIDADGYAILYLSQSYNVTLDEAASIICPTEKIEHPTAYGKRLSRAKELQSEIPNKRSIWTNLKTVLFKSKK